MRKIVITDKNYKMVFGMLRKFFAHKNFLYWYNFDKHGKKRFSSILKIKNVFEPNGVEKYNTKKVLKNVTTYDADFCLEPYLPKPFYSIYCDLIDGEDNIVIGDEIYFCSNRIIVKQKFDFANRDYLYECYQILTDNDNIEDLPSYNYEYSKYTNDKYYFDEDN